MHTKQDSNQQALTKEQLEQQEISLHHKLAHMGAYIPAQTKAKS